MAEATVSEALGCFRREELELLRCRRCMRRKDGHENYTVSMAHETRAAQVYIRARRSASAARIAATVPFAMSSQPGGEK